MHELDRQLGLLESTQLVRRLNEPDLAYLFKHILAQETTYQSLLVKTRRDIHLRVAQYYEQRDAEMPDVSAAILAHHYFEAGDLAKTFHYAIVAGDAAARLYAHAEALVYYDRALGIVNRLAGTDEHLGLPDAEIASLYTNRGRVYELSNRYDLAIENYIAMEMMGRAKPHPALELSGMTHRALLYSTYTPIFDPVQGKELNSRILHRARELGDRAAEAEILWIMLLLDKYGEANIEQAIEHGERSLAIARELGLRELVAYVLNDIAFPYAITSQFDAGRAALEEAIEIWRDLGNLPLLSDTLANFVQLDYYTGDLDKAIANSAESLRLSQLTGSLWGQAYSQMWLGGMIAERGDYGWALRVMREVLETAQKGNFLPPLVTTRLDLAWTLVELGQLEQAEAEAKLAAELMEGIRPFKVFVLALQLRLELCRGNVTAAAEISEHPDLRGDSPFKNDPDGMSRVVLGYAELALAKTEYAHALEILDDAIDFLTRLHVVPYVSDLLLLKARVLDAQGETTAALAVLADAEQRARVLPSRRVQWQIYGAASEMEAKRGNHERARELRAQGREVIEYISTHLGEALYRDSFLAQPQVQMLYQEN